MSNQMGKLKIKVKKGVNLAIRDPQKRSSDPYVVLTVGQQKMKTKAVKRNCNPEWNEEFTLAVTDRPINLTVYDKDWLTKDDKMGHAEIDFKPYMEWCVKMQFHQTPPYDNAIIGRVKPSSENCLAQESCIVWRSGKLIQDLFLRLNDVECGEVEVQLEFITIPAGSHI